MWLLKEPYDLFFRVDLQCIMRQYDHLLIVGNSVFFMKNTVNLSYEIGLKRGRPKAKNDADLTIILIDERWEKQGETSHLRHCYY